MLQPIDFEEKWLARVSKSTETQLCIPSRLLLSHEDALRACPHCGIVEPRAYRGGYLPRECEHMREERYAMQDQMYDIKEREKATARTVVEASNDMCYRWLGRDYSEEGLDTHSFETFHVITKDQMIAKALALKFVGNPTGNLIFHGACGRGKTHLACAIANRLRSAGTPVCFTTGPNLFNAIADRMAENHSYQDFLKRMYATPLLILDDIDKVPPTAFRQQVYFEVLNKRTNRGLPTILTTNVALKEYGSELRNVLGDAAASRLNIGLVLVGLRGEDYRQRLIVQE